LDVILNKLCSKIVTNSRATAKRFSRHAESKVRVVHNGVNIGWLKNDSAPRPGLLEEAWKVILIAARVSRWKRHDLALTAFEKVAEADPNAHLVCVGASDVLQPEWWKYLQDISRQSPFSNRIHWIGQVDDVRPWYRAAQLLLLTSDNEPFGRVLVEAMACGLPVVATRCGGVPEVVRHGMDGLLVTSRNIDQIANAIIRILKDKALRDRFSLSAQERAEYFCLNTHMEKMVEVFESVMVRHRTEN
jgi:glycosyltransferase involved in cell wall biosynthesis